MFKSGRIYLSFTIANLLLIALATLLVGLPATALAQSQSGDATLSALTVSPRDIIGFDADRESERDREAEAALGGGVQGVGVQGLVRPDTE